MQQKGDKAAPAGLMRRAEATPAIAVEVLVEQDIVAKMGIILQQSAAVEDRTPARGIPKEKPRQARGDVVSDLAQRHHTSRSGRAFQREVVTVERVETM